MIHNYRKVHCLEGDEHEEGVVESHGRVLFARTRSHFIERLVNEPNKPKFYSCNDIENS